ncbi:MAG: thiolase family protein [Dehalococcoidales bacterium]|nr:thiolase family protein [Dehalococcoidales bacterium]
MVTKNKDDVVIVSALRTPFGKYGGSLRDVDYYDLGAIPMREVVKRVKVDPGIVGHIFWGVGDTSECKDPFTPCAARQTLLKAGYPPTVPSISFDMACVSAMHAIKLAVMHIKAGEIDAAVCGGCTSFGQEPFILRGVRFGDTKFAQTLEDPVFPMTTKDFPPVSVESDLVATEYGISREEMDEWALRSHMNYGAAWNAGKFKDEIFPVSIPQGKGEPKILNIDEQYRADSSIEKLSKLKPIYGSKAITAGNAPGMNDGATAILLMRRSKAEELKLEVLATVVGCKHIAIRTSRMPEGPGFAMQKLLKECNLTLNDISCMEINEAFAAVPLVSMRILAENDKTKYKSIYDRMNLNGSAIAIGHPNTASGARVVMNLMYELRRRGGGYAMGGICGGLSQANTTIIRVD